MSCHATTRQSCGVGAPTTTVLEEGLPSHVVAQRLGVDRRSVRRWQRTGREQGRAGLKAQPASGRPPKLTSQQRRKLVRWILQRPGAWGFPTARWTCSAPVALPRSAPRPEPRNETTGAFVSGSINSGGALKKLSRLRTPLICLDEGLRRRTWAPRGLTPAPAIRQRRHEKGLGHRCPRRLSLPPTRQPLSGSHPQQNIRGRTAVFFVTSVAIGAGLYGFSGITASPTVSSTCASTNKLIQVAG